MAFSPLECDAGLFGENCSRFCGHCFEIKKCHHVTGICPKGCEPGYRGNDCKESKANIIVYDVIVS